MRWLACCGGLAALVITGCPPPQRPSPLPAIPMVDAVELVNANIVQIPGALRALGSVDGHFTTPEGARRSYHLDGVLFYLGPVYLRFDLKALGDRQFLFGSNADAYWVYQKDEGYVCGRHGEAGVLAPEIPVRPDQLLDALGLTPIGLDHSMVTPEDRVQRVVDDAQQVLFLVHNEAGDLILEKEYWLDRYPPRLVRRVLFRDADGVVTMTSDLDAYKQVESGGAWLPHRMTAEWPMAGARMRFSVRRWAYVEGVGPDGIQFATPRECEHR